MLNESNTLLEDDGVEEEILVEEECSVAQAVWGDIQGNIENQTDLQNALDAKQDSLTEAQLNAVNSGITAGKVATYDGYADQIASKADQSSLSAETTAREQADTALGRRIDNEALARQQADNGLQSQIDAITSQSDVVDVIANYAALQAYDTSSLSDNDVIKVLDDETHEDALTYYRWSTTTQTWTYIGQEAPYYSKGQMDVMLQGKQDKLTAGDNIQIQNGTISATDTTYTAGNGLNLNDGEFSADTDVLATKDDLEGYYTKPETDNLLAPKLEAEVAAELPTTGEEGKLYLTPKAHTTQTATGNPITATVAEDAGAIESFQLDGDTFQQSYNGSNLIDMPFTSGSHNGVTWIVNDDGSITLNGTATANAHLTANNVSIPAVAGETYTLSATGLQGIVNFGYKNIGSGNNIFVVTSDSPINTEQVTAEMIASADRLDMFITTGSSFSNQRVTLQLEKGSTATAYEPYVGGQPSPNPDYPQPIQTVTGEQTVEVIGKNLFDGVTTNQVISTDGTIVNNNNWNLGGFIKVEPNTAYTVSFRLGSGGSHSVLVSEFDSNEVFIIRTGSQSTTPYTFTTGSTTEYIRLNYNNTNNDTDFQIELGSTASDYVPYSKQMLSLDLGTIELCKLGTYQDYIYENEGEWYLRKECGKKNLLSTEVNMFELSEQSGYSRLYISKSSIGMPSGWESGIALCSNFKEITTGQVTTPGMFRLNTNGNNVAFYIPSSITTLNAAKSYMDGLSGSVICYALATPTDTVITDTTLIAQLEAIRTASLQNGANTITNTATGSNLAGDMEIGYYGFAPRNRYDKWLWLDINNEYEQIGS